MPPKRTKPLLTLHELAKLRVDAMKLISRAQDDEKSQLLDLLSRIHDGAQAVLDIVNPEFLQNHHLEREDVEEEQVEEYERVGLLVEGNEQGDYGLSVCYYLKAWALHARSELPFAEVEEDAQPSKKRKADSEGIPATAVECLEQAFDMYGEAIEPINEDEPGAWSLFILGGLMRSNAERGGIAILDDDHRKARKCLSMGHESFLFMNTPQLMDDDFNPLGGETSLLDEFGDPITPWISAISARLTLIDCAEEKHLSSADRLHRLEELTTSLKEQETDLGPVVTAMREKGEHLAMCAEWEYVVANALANALSVRFELVTNDNAASKKAAEKGE